MAAALWMLLVTLTVLVAASATQNSDPEYGNNVGCPRIVTRSQWGGRQPRNKRPLRQPVPKVLVHHTATGPCYSESSCARTMRSIQKYHMDDLKWADIGYNFLVGEDGNVYEGRGWDVIGAHTGKWNPVSYGISVIGNFMAKVPNAAAQNAVKQLIACGVRRGKLSSAYTLHGHRDGMPTSCPGNAFYSLIRTWPRYGGKLRNED